MRRKRIMKPLIYSLVLGTVFLFSEAEAQSYKRTKTYDKTFALNQQMDVSIINKYGDIQVVNWEKDSVKIHVDVEVNSSKPSKTHKLFSAIDVQFSSSHFYIIAQTNLAGQNSLWTDITDLSKLVVNSSTYTRINYIIYLPMTSKLNIQNKFGNIYLADFKGDLSVDLSNGDLKAHNLTGKTKLKVSFGGLIINQLAKSYLESTYLDAEIQECDMLETNTSTTTLNIGKIGELSMNSAHDKYYLGDVRTISGTSRFNFLKINQLQGSIDIIQKFGTIHIKELNEDLEKFKLSTYKTDIHLSLANSRSYMIDIRYVKPPVIQYPTVILERKEEMIDAATALQSITLKLGQPTAKPFPLNIQAEEGNIFMNLK